MYRDRTGNILVHLVNYDYSLATDLFYTKTNIQVQVQVGSQPVDDVILRSPDITGTQALPFTRSGGIITVTVPEVDAWVVLYFQQNAFAPVITSASPATSLGAVGENSLSFSVQASDPDGNPLTYIWSVNGQVVTNIFGSSYSLQLPPTASGIYTVTVVVTDGSRITQTSWNINVTPYRTPRFLFDETHAERNTLSAARAQQLSPGNPAGVLFSILGQALAPNYQVTDLLNGTAGSLTPQVLSGADVLVLAAPNTALTAAENQAVASFVQSGGGLVFLGEAGLNTSINALIEPWGIEFDDNQIESPQDLDGYADIFNLSSFANNPAVGVNPSFQVNNGGSLIISQGGVALGETSAAEWRSVSRAATQQAGDPSGPFTMVASAQFGKGRIFAVSDNRLDDSTLQYTAFAGNLNLFLSGLAWVTSSVNATPPPPAGGTSTPKILPGGVVPVYSSVNTIQPSSWLSIYGSNLASSTVSWNGNFPTSLGGTSVLINGRAAYLSFVSPGLINLQAPNDTTTGTVSVVVMTASGSASSTVTLAQFGPSFLLLDAKHVAGVIIRSDGSGAYGGGTYDIIGPTGTSLGYPTVAAKAGDNVALYGVGFGPTNPAVPAGQAFSGAAATTNSVELLINNVSVTPAFAGLSGPGLCQINLTIPPGLGTGDVSLAVAVGGAHTPAGVVISLQ